MRNIFKLAIIAALLVSCGEKESPEAPSKSPLTVVELRVGDRVGTSDFSDVPVDPTITVEFSHPIDASTIDSRVLLKDGSTVVELASREVQGAEVTLTPKAELKYETKYTLNLNSGIKALGGEELSRGTSFGITTMRDTTDKFERITDEELLTKVQEYTFKYFWDFGHPNSGMARERTTSGSTVTTGGTGFGVMAMVAAVERGFITRAEGLERVTKIANFLKNSCTKYHGAFAHWINGDTGETRPFSEKDNGGDIVETALLFQGLLTARGYFDGASAEESALRATISELWEAIEWTWYQNGSDAIYWHWSEEYGFEMNMKVSGWNEALIVYVLAASSPTYPITADIYHSGWARNGAMANGKEYYGYTLPLGYEYGGPLFFAHYSFMGLDPNRLSDSYADYFEQGRAHTLINYEYCKANPLGYDGYSEECWGLTASDGDEGYSAHSPTNDRGVIAPTAALSSMPYTPEESMAALRYFYYKLGDKLWGEYGFRDAFNLTANWVDEQYIAIDQGPIIVMIENYRSGLLWDIFMADSEIVGGLTKLGFTIK